MDRKVRTRGPRPGRGVRTRGGSGGRSTPGCVLESPRQVEVVAVPERGRGRGRGRRGWRGRTTESCKRTEPLAESDFSQSDTGHGSTRMRIIDESLHEERSLETPLRVKRRCVWSQAISKSPVPLSRQSVELEEESLAAAEERPHSPDFLISGIRVRTRRPGRGVRTRGGDRSAPGRDLEAPSQVEVVAVPERGRGSGRRGWRGRTTGSRKRPQPLAESDSSQSGTEHGSTRSTSTSPLPLAPVEVEEVGYQSVEVEEASSLVAEEPPHSPDFPPSPGMFLECGGSSAATSPVSTPAHSPRSHQTLRDEEISFDINYGSESEFNETDDDGLMQPIIPRTFWIAWETPEDDDEDLMADLDRPTADGETEESTNFLDFKWKPFPDPPIRPESRRETFSNSNVGPTTPCIDPYDTFVAIWDQQFMEHIVSETNRYAQEVAHRMLMNNNLHPHSRINEWQDTNVDELYTYLAILLAMGVVIKSRVTEYWSAATDIFCTPGFRVHMTLKRFQLISKCLHFSNNGDLCTLKLDPFEAKLFKIKPVLSHLNRKFQEMYTMRQNIALDESLLHWRGWMDVNQFISDKAATGIKTYELCESQTGYLWRFEVHAHNRFVPQNPQNPLDRFTPTIVLRLIRGLENKGYTLWMNDFYNSPALARRLKSLGFDCAGTLRTNRRFVPEVLRSLTKKDMYPGQVTGFTSGDVDVMVWRDLNRVAMISTYHGNVITTANETSKPRLIIDYNTMMSGVDKKDQMLAMFGERKQTRVWYKKFFHRLLNVSVLNSYILVKQSSSKVIHRCFRLDLIKSLLSKHSSPSSSFVAPARRTMYEAKMHYLADYPLKPGQPGQRLRRLCRVCKKRVHTYCVGCDVPVCINTCFCSLHS